jgi:type I restriction enzyme S subunit
MIDLEIINLTEALESKIDKSKWKSFKFSDLVENIVEKVVPKNSGLKYYIGLEHLDSGSLKIKRFGETESLIGDKLKIYKGDLIFAKRNSYLKRVAIAEFDAVASAHSMVLRPKSKNVDPKFLPFFMMSEVFWKRAIEISVGSLSPTINWKTLAKQEFLLPPKAEQARLAELLWAIDEVIEKEKDVLNRLHLGFKAEMKSIYLHEITKHKRIKSLVDLSTGKRMKGGGLETGDVLSVGGENINNTGQLIYERNVYISEEFFKDMKSGVIKQGDILMMKDGAKTGKVAFVDKEIKAATNEHLFIIRTISNQLNQKYLYYFLLSDYGQMQIANFFHGIIGGVTRDDVNELKLPLYDEKKQQDSIKILDLFMNSIEQSKSKIEASQSLQKSLINQIF